MDWLTSAPVADVLARQATNIVEFGTSFGVSTIYLATALRDGGGGQLIGTELEPDKARRAHENLAAAGLDDIVDIRVGDALRTLRDDVTDGVDLSVGHCGERRRAIRCVPQLRA
jgi:predicted O-methyltransferase YrrM